MKPWREIAVPNHDVLESTFLQSEFAADITAVRTGKATREYQDAAAFFQRTFITEGMRLLLIQVAQRLNGKGGEPVIQLQTAFGGGKTHTMLAVYHLATRNCPLADLSGIPDLIEQSGMMNVPQARVAVIDGIAHSPGQAWNHDNQKIHTLWGELAWQLGGAEGYALVKDSDVNGTSPGKNVLKTLLEMHAPCVVLMDELVAYMRQFQEGQPLSGGSFDSNLSFMHALTEACKLVPNAILLGSLPESELEAGSQRGVAALKALENTFVRVQALWKPVAAEEAFEIVRRRLFEPIRDEDGRAAVCQAFAKLYISEGDRLPSETQQANYSDRLLRAYPIHPEVFDRLYEDWTTIDGFQRTRGVLKLMAKVIHKLWKDNNKDLLILPGSLPLYDGGTRNELTYYLPPGWDAVLEKDIDGDRAETTELENKEPRFGTVNAARRIARAIFLGSAPSSIVTKAGIRGVDRARALLGCLQPGQTSSIYSDALNRLADLLHYLNNSGEKTDNGTRYWFDTRANLRREMEQRKQRFDQKTEVRSKMVEVLGKISAGATLFGGVHPFTPHADVPDDSSLRLVFLSPECWYTREEPRLAFESILDYLRNNGPKPRFRGNRLIFLAPDHGALARLRDCIQVALAWKSIVDDLSAMRLVLDTLQIEQAKRELQSAENVLPRAARECYKWLLCPLQNSAADPKPTVEGFPLNTNGSGLGNEIERVCTENELVISAWSPVHLRSKLQELYWRPDKPAIEAMAFWEDTLRYLYLPRLKSREVLSQAIVKGAASTDFFGTAYGQHDSKFDGFKIGDPNVQLDDTLLLIQPEVAIQYQKALLDVSEPTVGNSTSASVLSSNATKTGTVAEPIADRALAVTVTTQRKAMAFHSSVEVHAATAKVRMVQLADEIISILASDPQANLRITLEINADFPAGVSDQIKRAVSENSKSLGFEAIWE
jgi:predicted AAA+ superfamily ATPase